MTLKDFYQFEGCIGMKLDPSDNELNLQKKRIIFRGFIISQRIFSLDSLKLGGTFLTHTQQSLAKKKNK